jgi:hypothetical protein
MCFLNSISDDTPGASSQDLGISTNTLRWIGDDLRNRMHDVARMVEGRRDGDLNFASGACNRMYLTLARNALDEITRSLKDVEAEVLPRPVPDSRLPAVASVGSL